MRLRLLTPIEVIVDESVNKIVADGEHGSFCLLPNHIDFLAAIVPGLVSFEDAERNESFVAVDEGILVKKGDEVLISVRQAVRGGDLDKLRMIVHREFVTLDERERAAKAATAKLEASFLRGFMELAEEQP